MSHSPPGFHVCFSARTERLLEALARDIETPPDDPTARECIVVQSQGMARWLELQLSTRFGVWAHPWFPFPEELAFYLWRDVTRQRQKGRGSHNAFDREGLAWGVAAALPELLDDPELEPLRAWVGTAREPARVMSLARRIGTVFHGYLLHRPDMLLQWEDAPDFAVLPAGLPGAAAEDAAWQAILWRKVVARAEAAGTSQPHPARRAKALLDQLHDARSGASHRLWRFPRVSVFGLSALSPLYVELLAALGRHVAVHLYSLAASPTDALRVMEAVRGTSWRPDDLVSADHATDLLAQLCPVHPLVEDQANALRSFQMLVALHGATVTELPTESQLKRSAERPTSLLHHLQANVAGGREPSLQPSAVRRSLTGDDPSLSFHNCHGPLREVEVVRDQLLKAFDEVEGLAPHDVVVMVPDVEAYAPYVEAVFSTGHEEELAIPFRVADRLPRVERPGVQAFLQSLHVLRGRMTAPEVLDLLALSPVRAARGLDEEAIDSLRAMIEAAGIRWGLDAEHRAAVGQPVLDANTWRWGLTRLMLGWAAPGDGRGRYHGMLPSPAAGAEPALLGALAGFWDFLGRRRADLLEAWWDLDTWLEQLGGLLRELLGEGAATEDDRLLVEARLGRLAERAHAAGYDGLLDLDAISQLADGALAEETPPRGFLEGAVTVCALQPMRAIPFRVVVLMGLNDGAFPRTDRPPGFDLAARQPRLGDTLRRDTDRLLFLEALTCARDQVILTWTGQDPRTDVELPPSVVVSELLDVLRQMAASVEDTDPASTFSLEKLVLKHPMHAFSPRYFGADKDPRLFSHVSAYARTADASSGPRRTRPRLVPAALPPPEPGEEQEVLIPLDALARFLESPAKRLVRDGLDIDLPEQPEPLANREPMQLGNLDRYWVGESLLAATLAGADPEEAIAIATAEGRLPLGTPGRLDVAPVLATAEQLAALAAPLRQGGAARATSIDLAFPELGARLVGTLDHLWPAGRVEAGFGRLDVRRELRLWVRHLVWNVAREEGAALECAPVTWAIGRPVRTGPPALRRLDPVANAREHLATVVRLWLEAERTLVPFFPLAAQAYVQTLGSGPAGSGDAADPGLAADAEGAPRATADDALDAALRKAADAFGSGRREAEPSDWPQREDLEDRYLELALGDALPWDEDDHIADEALVARFRELAVGILAPLESALTRAQGENARALVAELGP